MPSSSDKPLTYADAGVDIDRGSRLVERIKQAAHSTRREGVLAGIGGFGAAFELPLDRYRRPVLVSGTDGVGTKLRLAIDCERHRGVGVDLVAMCVNDVLTLGAEPLYFLDYFATGALDEANAAEVVEGIADGCRMSGAALIGGETAEMPGMYADGDYDLAGFCVAVVEKDRILGGARVAVGDRLLGVASSGAHSNGFSLIRRVLERAGDDLHRRFDGERTLADVLLEPTRIYVGPLLAALARTQSIHALAHITGGGLLENVPRMLANGQRARIDRASWDRPPLFRWIEDVGHIEEREMLRTFNCGIGLVVVVAPDRADDVANGLSMSGETVFHIGTIEQHDGSASISID